MLFSGKKIVTAALCALLAASPLVGCAGNAKKADDAAAKKEEAYKEGEEADFKGKRVPYSGQGTYTVTFGEADLLALGQDPFGGEAAADGGADAAADSSSAAADEQRKADDERAEAERKAAEEQAAADAKALEDARAALEGARSARDEAQRAADEARAAEETAKAEADEAERARADAEQKRDEAERAKAEAEQKATSDAVEADATGAAAGDDAAKAAKEAAEAAGKAAQEKAEAASKAAEARTQADDALAKADEAAREAEQRVADLEGKKADAGASSSSEAQQEAKADDKKAEKKAFADVKLEDVRVYYGVMTNRAEVEADASGATEPKLEEREAKVNALANDNGSITLSFTDPDAASNATGSYSVAIKALGKYLPVMAESALPQLSAESNAKADSESCDVTIKAEGAKFADGLKAGDLRLGGSFADMKVNGAEASGDALTVHLSGRPKLDYDLAGYVTDGQIVVPASGFEGSAEGATAFVDVKVPDEAYDLGGAEALPAAAATGEAESSTIEGDTGRATVYLSADLGEFKDVRPESIALDDDFAGGKVESVTREGEDGELLKVELTFPASGQEADGHALAGTVRLAAGAMDDESGKAAPEVETTVALAPTKADDKKSEEDKKKEEEKKKEREEKSKTLKSYGDGFTYASEKLKKVDPTIAEIAKFYGEALNLASNIAAGKYLDAIKSVEGLLKICGIIEPDAKEVTAADVLEEVKALRMVVEAIDRKIDVNTEENRADRYTQAFIRLSRMQSNCNRLRGIYEKGAKILATRKDNPMKAPAKGASKEEVSRYNNELRRVITQECDKQNAGKDNGTPWAVKLKSALAELDKDLFTLSGWVSIDKNAPNAAANPINLLDKLVSTKVNWDSQGYYARAAFRTELQYTMLTSWAFLATYYDYSDPDIAKQEKTTAEAMAAALKQIQARPAGQTPDEIRKLNRAGKDVRVYSPSLGITVKRARMITKGGMEIGLKNIQDIPEAKIDQYVSRLKSGKSRNLIHNDLELAGLDVWDGNKYDYVGFRHHTDKRKLPFSTGLTPMWESREMTFTYMRHGLNPLAPTTIAKRDKVFGLKDGYETYCHEIHKNRKKDVITYFKQPFMWFDRA